MGIHQAMFFAGATAPLALTGPSSVSGSGGSITTGATVQVTTSSANCIVSGGVAPYTYAWTYVSGTNAVITTPTGQASTFRRSMITPDVGAPPVTQTGVFRCTVTDGNSNTATHNVTAETTIFNLT